jgi:large subunit ribosomal protein L2
MLKRRRGGTPGQRHGRRRKVETEGGRKRVPGEVSKGKRQKAGRNNRGRVTVRHRGGGVKRLRRKRVNGGKEMGLGRVRGVQYDPNRTGRVARRKVRKGETREAERGNKYKYSLAVEGRKVGDRIQYGEVKEGRGGMERESGERRKRGRRVSMGSEVKTRGSNRQRKNRVGGMKVCNVAVEPGKGGKYRRSAGGSGELRQKRHGYAQIRRKGGKRREVSDECTATVGMVSGEEHRKECRGKAGSKRRRGWRPTVRGEAMNPIDHPHGGRTRGGRPEVTPWTRRAKGKPTRKKGKKRGRGWNVRK